VFCSCQRWSPTKTSVISDEGFDDPIPLPLLIGPVDASALQFSFSDLAVGFAGFSRKERPETFDIMWSYLKNDIAELVSVVKEDTNLVFEKVQAADETEPKRITPAMKEAVRRMNEEETFTVLLFTLPTKATSESTESTVSPDGEEENDDIHPADYAEAAEVETFRKSFDIKERTHEIADFLEKHPDTLKVQFESLVPEVVRYDEFWERFFYRCNEQRIESEWAAEDERARISRAELVGTVSSFFGNAAKAVATGVASALTEDDDTNPNRSKGLQGIFGAAGRPPFVMNTAVDEDDAEEEEELGWDDEDEEEAEQPSGVDVSDLGTPLRDEADEEQIVFKDEALESVTEQLKQAIEERDQLHQTVNLQTKEIASLKSSSEASAKEINELRKGPQLKESSTLSDFAPNADSKDEGTSKATDEIRRLKELVAAKDMELSNLIGSVDALTKENEHLCKSHAEAVSLLGAEKGEISALRSELATLRAELDNTKQSLGSAMDDIARLTTEVDEERAKKDSPLKESIAKIEEDSRSGTKSHETSDTTSTGVNVEKPTVVSKVLVNDDDDEEGWGDDWD
jgi:BSD domain